jgi:hypothetical protein
MALWIIVVLLALLLFIEIRNGQYLATILAEIRDFLDEQPYRKTRLAQQEAELADHWQAEARRQAGDE